MTKHTPAPWHRDGFNLSAIIRLKFPIGHPDCKHITGTYETIARCEGENWDANARLIAAAPELLEALKDIQRSLDFSTNGGTSKNRFECELLKIANSAIAKAEGK